MKAVGDEVTDLVLIQLLGWLKTRTDHDIAARRPALVHARDFRIELVSLARKFDRQQILASFASPLLPADAQQQHHLVTSTYIEQLDLIESSDEDKLGAVADYLSAEADRIAWAERGLVHSSTFDQLEKELTVAWRSYRTRVTVQSADRGARCCGAITVSLFAGPSFALWTTKRDPQMLRILLSSSRFRPRYDPAKHAPVEITVRPC